MFKDLANTAITNRTVWRVRPLSSLSLHSPAWALSRLLTQHSCTGFRIGTATYPEGSRFSVYGFEVSGLDRFGV